MNWFDAEKFFERQIPKCSGWSVLITCCDLFYLTIFRVASGKEKREKRCVCRIVGDVCVVIPPTLCL